MIGTMILIVWVCHEIEKINSKIVETPTKSKEPIIKQPWENSYDQTTTSLPPIIKEFTKEEAVAEVERQKSHYKHRNQNK